MISESPILFWNNPVGSTSTIVSLCYRQAGIPIPKPIAGLLLAGVISDTLNLTSPTATPIDREIVEHLCKVAGVDARELAAEIFAVGSPLLTMTPAQTIQADSKEYDVRPRPFRRRADRGTELQPSAGETGRAHRSARPARPRPGAAFHGPAGHRYQHPELPPPRLWLRLIPPRDRFPPARPANVWELEGVVSRKKQLLPYLLRCVETDALIRVHSAQTRSCPFPQILSRVRIISGHSRLSSAR